MKASAVRSDDVYSKIWKKDMEFSGNYWDTGNSWPGFSVWNGTWEWEESDSINDTE